ncbi:MAG: S8 family serine peptidase [Caldilineaceae bacterium]
MVRFQIAPRARIIAYRSLGNQGALAQTYAAIDQAADGVDVINYSVGGGASLTGGDDIAYLFAADAGVFVATSAGNSGPNPETLAVRASVPWLTSVGANTQNASSKARFPRATAEYWPVPPSRPAPRNYPWWTPPMPAMNFAHREHWILTLCGVRSSSVLRGEVGRADKSLAVSSRRQRHDPLQCQ